MSNLHRLVYTSKNQLVGDEMEMSAAVLEICRTSQRNNAGIGVTGALLFNKSAFAQVLEGPGPAVESTFERVQRDERHGDVTVLQFAPVSERKFGDWSMAFVGCSPSGRQQWNELAEKSGFDATRMDGDAVLTMLHGLLLEEEGMPPAAPPAAPPAVLPAVLPPPVGDGPVRPSGGLDAGQVRAELSEIHPGAQRSAAGADAGPENGRACADPVLRDAARSNEPSALAVLRKALADERQRTTDLRVENDGLQIAMAARCEALLAMKRERNSWADRARLLAAIIGRQAEALQAEAETAPSEAGSRPASSRVAA